MKFDLATEDGLRDALRAIGEPATWEARHQQWADDLARTIEQVRVADRDVRQTPEFQRMLWENNHVAATGQGNISVDAAIANPTFREWLAERSMEQLPSNREASIEFLSRFYEDLSTEVLRYAPGRRPSLKVFRVVAALYPAAMTTIADRGKLLRLARRMGVTWGVTDIARHIWIRERLDQLAGVAGEDPQQLAERMVLPWLLFEKCVDAPDEKNRKQDVQLETTTRLHPLPANRRLRGLTAIRGRFDTLLAILEFVGDGATRDEILEFLRGLAPELKVSSQKVTINTLQSQFDVIRREGEKYFPTERGILVMESRDPSELADWLLTRILGVDHLIVALDKQGPLTDSAVVDVLRRAHPGLSTDFAPRAMMGWLQSLGVIELVDGHYQLAEMGREWAAMIDWTPEALQPDQAEVEFAPATPPPPLQPLSYPSAADIAAGIPAFPPADVARLHAGLWANARRHFAILTGLSGSGKTQLAKQYAQQLTADSTGRQLLLLPVQPGWYDPGALLGYINPIRNDNYVRTPFLEFLLAAANNPDRPFVVIFDEMNLSHPEQYMAPILSAMETGLPIHLHSEEENFDGVPKSVPYPANLVLIGTVNMDETTHGLSDKILDRAFVLEFWDINLSDYARWDRGTLAPAQVERVRQLLRELMAELAPARLHFGWRVVEDVLDYLEQAGAAAELLPFDGALDDVIAAKILPKLRGEDGARMRAAFHGCQSVLSRHGLERSAGKLKSLQDDLAHTGSARFWR